MFGIRNIGTFITILLVFHGTAFAVDNNITIKDLAMKQRELINAKMQAELNKLQPTKDTKVGLSALSVPDGTLNRNDKQRENQKESRIILVAVYGVDKSLTADLLLNGAVVSAKQDDVVNGWKVKKIQPTHIEMSKGRETKTFNVSVDGKQNLYDSQQPSPSVAPLPSGFMDVSASNSSVFAPPTPSIEMR